MKKTVLTLAAIAMTTMASALPKVVWQCDFEGVSSVADIAGAEQVGSGQFLQSTDSNFGTYYQNNPDGETKSHTNYLIVPTTGFVDCAALSTSTFSIGFWVNTYVANEKQGYTADGHWYSTILSAYSSTRSHKTFGTPMFSARTRQTLQINCDGWSDYVAAENTKDVVTESLDWCHTDSVDDGTGTKVATAFDKNWHYIAFVFNKLNAKYYIDGNIVNEWNATNNNYSFPTAMAALNELYLGDCGPFWNDKDGAYAYDDIRLYSGALSDDDVLNIMKMKRGEMTEDGKKELAKADFDAACDALRNMEFEAVGLETYKQVLSDKVEEFDDDMYDNYNTYTLEQVQQKTAEVQNLQAEATNVLNAYQDYLNVQDYYVAISGKYVYPGKDAYDAAIDADKVKDADVTSLETCKTAIAAAEKAMRADLVTYVYTQTTTPVDASVLVENNAFTSNINDCFAEASTPTKEGWESIGTSGNYDAASYSSVIASLPSQTLTSVFVYSETCYKSKETIGYQQTLTDLKPGYYKATGKIGTHCVITTQRVFAKTADNEVYTNLPANGKWYELKTPYIMVGEDGTLTLGCKTEGNGYQWDGSVYMSNFGLSYYGETPDFSSDAQESLANLKNGIAAASIWAGDKTAENAKLDELTTLAETDPAAALAKSEAEITNIQSIEAKEASFKNGTYANLQGDATNLKADTTSLKDVKALDGKCYEQVLATMDNIMAADTTTYAAIATMNDLNTAVRAFVVMVDRICEFDEALRAQATSSSYYLTDMSASDINALIPILKGSMIASIPNVKSAATLAAPMEVTGVIDNPTFKSNSIANWDYAEAPNSYIYEEVEYFNFDKVSFTQTIKSLPKGTYKLTANSFYRDGGDLATAVKNYYAGAYKPLPILAGLMSDGNGYAINIRSVGSDSLVVNEGDPDTFLSDINVETSIADNYYCAKSEFPKVYYSTGMASAYNEFTRRNAYVNELYVVVPETGDVTIGIKKNGKAEGDWVIFDNFRLYYCGQEVPDASLLHPYKSTVKGDVNGDGSVNISDVNAVISVMCGDTTYAASADVNGDGSVNISDVNAVITIMCGGTL